MTDHTRGAPTLASRLRALVTGATRLRSIPPMPRPATDASRPRVLCVDDNLDMLHLLQRHLQADYQVVTASDGSSALEILKSGATFDAIISDLSMPGLHGVTFLKEAHRIAPGIPCIILTGQNDPITRATARNAAGAQWLLFKPYSKTELFSVVREATAGKTQPAQGPFGGAP